MLSTMVGEWWLRLVNGFIPLALAINWAWLMVNDWRFIGEWLSDGWVIDGWSRMANVGKLFKHMVIMLILLFSVPITKLVKLTPIAQVYKDHSGDSFFVIHEHSWSLPVIASYRIMVFKNSTVQFDDVIIDFVYLIKGHHFTWMSHWTSIQNPHAGVSTGILSSS